MQAVPSTYHQCVIFLPLDGIHEHYGNQCTSRACYMSNQKLKVKYQLHHIQSSELTKKKSSHIRHMKSVGTVVQVCIDEEIPKKCVNIGVNLQENLKEKFIVLLKNNNKSFAWSVADMSGIEKCVISHELNVDLTFKPIKHKRRKLGHD